MKPVDLCERDLAAAVARLEMERMAAARDSESNCGWRRRHSCKRLEAQWKERTSVSDQRSQRFHVNCNNAHVYNI
jgi:hypothetical protein